eukprot:CAMPEP_0179072278 /NCGR_PEP_ID=MMETSP0796-20121207/31971_1 /TAXON_ID=73915 /ORGANISM="Pyrodinium bahamense, Strain pbaha01" /LENGTH=291 /DNA_ID=CAMNT_0020769431 /DNA_START=3 /DNA_END=874 /DNA_ORIENTATION=-
MAQATTRQRAAYGGRESTSTRNPHSATVQAVSLAAKELARLSPEERILAQWRAAYGCPVSDEAKAQFCVNALGKTYSLSDIRLWQAHHPQSSSKDANATEKGTIYLEFFFDGSPSEIQGHEEEFTKAFERMIEQQLQEQRLSDFRRRLTTRRRAKGPARREESGSGGCDTSAEGGASAAADEDWKAYLRKPVPATELSIRSMREAGCMLRFLVCQTSVSIAASENLGQIAFQEHFPIDGVAQEASRSTKPMPRWVYGMMVLAATMTLLFILAWWQIVKKVVFGRSSDIAGA